MLKLNLGCASRLLEGYINIDVDSLDNIKARYPNLEICEDRKFLQCDVLNLPYGDGTVDEVRADSILEHMSFLEEPQFFYEAKRILKPGGVLDFSVPDFEEIVRKWLAAKDEWKDFFRNDEKAIRECHWFGQYSYATDNRWGYLTAGIFGPQNGIGQFHKNAYTVPKIRAICKKLSFEEPSIENFYWKGDRDLMIRVKVKRGIS